MKQIFGAQIKVDTLNNKIRRDLIVLIFVIALLWIPALIGSETIQGVASLYRLANSPNPYLLPEYGVRLYMWAPLVVLSASVLFMSPGLFLALSMDLVKDVEHWVIYGFGLSLIVVTLFTYVVEIISESPLTGRLFATSTAFCAILCFGLVILRFSIGRNITNPLSSKHSIRDLILVGLVPVLLLVFLAPKFYWENFNGDGAHAFEATRLLLKQGFPFWDASAGEISSFPGMTSLLFTYPASWFLRLFGANEATVRLPYLLYLSILFATIVALVEYKRIRALSLLERILIWLALIIYSLVMAYSATYSPYSADIALPATQDTLLMVCFLGFVLAYFESNSIWTVIFIALTYLSSPNGILLIGLFILAVIVVEKKFNWNQLRIPIVTVLACLVTFTAFTRLLEYFQQPIPGSEYGVVGLLSRFAFLQYSEWRRLLFLIVPVGILPALSLLTWKRQDVVARKIALLTCFYFVFFYFQATISLHHFAPVMVLPLVFFWRSDWVTDLSRRSWMLPITVITGFIALFVSLPKNFLPLTEARVIGSAIQNNIEGYEDLNPDVFRSSEILTNLFPYAWDPSVPHENYGGSPLVWNYYAHQESKSSLGINYLIQYIGDPKPENMYLLAQEDDFTLYVRSEELLALHRSIRPSTPAGSTIYNLPRGILFRSVPLDNGPRIINVVEILDNLGIDTDIILQRLGG